MLTYKTNETKIEQKSFKNKQGEIISYFEQKVVDDGTIFILRSGIELKINTTYQVKVSNMQIVNGFQFVTLKVKQ